LEKLSSEVCSDLSRRKRKIIATGLKAERWVDRWAAERMMEYYPDHDYRWGYLDTENVKNYRNFYLARFRD